MAELRVSRDDITTLNVDAIVNAANSTLLGGGGVDGAIHRAAGRELYEECLRIPEGASGRCAPGAARITDAYKLPCKKIIHTVGPVYKNGTSGEGGTLAACYANSLRLAAQHGLETIAFPNISTGVYGYPKDEAACIALKSVRETCAVLSSLRVVIFICFDSENYALYTKLLAN
ncbi:MAG: O-acetyl-ADP-ribose deacetylase [Spirochaetaceae bacterium]|jgi:O-acetyl-ADP-ribose deacetylase (regulator of RNase III)|nr:O-acetyl-ADP-ribose deacetylase [Spirochaetaceae bacterium]